MSVPDCTYHLDAISALLDAGPGAVLSADTLRHIQSCASCRREYEWLVNVSKDLEEIGSLAARQAPAVDLTAEVMARVSAIAAPAQALKPYRAPRRYMVRYAGLAGLAAAAGIAVFFWFSVRHDGTTQEPSELALSQQDNEARFPHPPSESVSSPGNQQSSLDELQKAIGLLHKYDASAASKKPVFENTAPPDLHALTASEVWATTRASVTDAGARDRLRRWASLAPERAKQVTQSPGASPGAIIGAAASLDPAEAAPLLLTALSSYADRPAAHMALSKAYLSRFVNLQGNDPAGSRPDSAPPSGLPSGPGSSDVSADAIAAADDWIASDPKNALPYCLKALLLLEQAQPDIEGALKLLSQASMLPSASAYGLDSAGFNQEALIAAGMDPETAKTLSALTAGQSQNDFLVKFSQNLLDKARQSLNQGDLQTARAITEAVQQLGSQVGTGAQLSQERLAAMEMQRQAITLLETIYTGLGSTSDIQQLTLDTQKLAGNMESFTSFLNDLGNLFIGATDQVFGLITDIIRQTGDLTLFDHLPS
ncbi:MAG: hypothetical protein HZB26_11590 [Candidatus Hydrogenedentes bacterium]|nr:hypothetical protein [Candidatus Hydrogenedentota bacterium]